MELSQAKRFIYKDYDNNTLYISKDFWELMDRANNIVSLILAVCDTPAGEQVFEMNTTYNDEHFIYRRFMHLDSFIKFNNDYKIKNI